MRGEKSIYKDLFNNTVVISETEKQRPRNVLMPERDLLLVYRYYYHVEINRMRFDDVLKQLEKEFFIVTARIVVVITDNDEQLRQIVKQKPAAPDLKKLYPHIDWKFSPIK